ncbi:MAG: CDC27 family protein [Sulfurovum sp.]|nr:CDC27 family protein [Sulfurovum sp.]
MYDIDRLEKQWSRYNKKRKRPLYISLFLLTLGIALAAGVYLNDTLRDSLIALLQKDSRHQTVAAAEKLPPSEANVSVENEPMKSEEKANIPKVVIEVEPNPYDVASKEPVLEPVESLERVPEAKSDSPKPESAHKKMHLDILDTSSVTAYKDVESRFYQTHDTDDSLFLARSYFNRGEYKKAEYWALQTNKVDNSIEESWLLFAHAKAKLGQKQDAIKVLKSYIIKTNSIEAKRLLEQIK